LAAAEALSIERIPGADWVARSLAGLRPVRAGRFIVHGAHDRAGLRANDIGIEIEAALAFGTGHHGTTRGCLLALADLTKRRRIRNVLDIGTGSGVLAIAAARLLRTRITAGDIDPVAVRAARDNAEQNHALSMVTFSRAAGVCAQTIRTRGPYDLIFANILMAPRRVDPQTRRPRSPCCPFWPAAWPRQCCRRDLSRPRPFAGAADHP
jgi:ribosomal protein L11 methyltransferase